MDRSDHMTALMKRAADETGRDLQKEEVDRAFENGESFGVDELLDMLNPSSHDNS